jgi:ankyrin repeat protein
LQIARNPLDVCYCRGKQIGGFQMIGRINTETLAIQLRDMTLSLQSLLTLPNDELLIKASERDAEGNSIFHRLASHEQGLASLPEILRQLEGETRLVVMNDKNLHGDTIWHLVVNTIQAFASPRYELVVGDICTLRNPNEKDLLNNQKRKFVFNDIEGNSILSEAVKLTNELDCRLTSRPLEIMDAHEKRLNILCNLFELILEKDRSKAITETNKDGNTFFHLLATIYKSSGSLLTILNLLPGNEYSTEFKIRNNHGNTLIHNIALHGDLNAMRVFLRKLGGQRRELLDAENEDGDTPLHLSACNSSEMLHLILACYQPNEWVMVLEKRNKLGSKVLHKAAEKGEFECVNAVLQRYLAEDRLNTSKEVNLPLNGIMIIEVEATH